MNKLKKSIQGSHAIVDMDNTLVDLDGRFKSIVLPQLPAEVIAMWDKTMYWIEDSFPEEYHEQIHSFFKSEKYFLEMIPKPGALEALKEMEAEGMRIQICTSPHPGSEFCIPEKREWVRQYLGSKYEKEMIFSHDKTGETGDVLFDDRADIIELGERVPSWTQVLIDAEYNQHVDTPYRLKEWRNWRDVVYKILKGPE